jgi:hypothetical protein
MKDFTGQIILAVALVIAAFLLRSKPEPQPHFQLIWRQDDQVPAKFETTTGRLWIFSVEGKKWIELGKTNSP